LSLPFTIAQFLEVFRQYHAAIGVAQALILMVGVVGLSFAFWANQLSGRLVAASLAILWVWMGGVYHALFFSRINPPAYLFALLFLIQAVLFLKTGVLDSRLRFQFSPTARGWLGALIQVYALAVYPALSFRGYPAAPSFGVPCPTVLFTFGLLCWSNASWRLWIVPCVWAAIGTSAGFLLGMPQDGALAVVAVLGLLVRQRLQ
jgi:hypothetical protein